MRTDVPGPALPPDPSVVTRASKTGLIDGHRLVGMISEADLARYLPEAPVGHFVETICAAR
ncbi:hypothetical protein ACFYRG_36280 [Streptomyces mirabilis]|uniref:hypothetical protein n=1 Tax=Streptomyces mirabilis TaxID=68239 RepID=UPI0036BA3986